MKISLIILFGSQAAKKSGVNSDIDVAVLADRPLTLKDKISISRKAARMLKASEDNIDIVDLRFAPPLLQHEIAEAGKLLYGKKSDFIRFRVLAWKRYLDTAKFRRARKEALKNTLYVK